MAAIPTLPISSDTNTNDPGNISVEVGPVKTVKRKRDSETETEAEAVSKTSVSDTELTELTLVPLAVHINRLQIATDEKDVVEILSRLFAEARADYELWEDRENTKQQSLLSENKNRSERPERTANVMGKRWDDEWSTFLSSGSVEEQATHKKELDQWRDKISARFKTPLSAIAAAIADDDDDFYGPFGWPAKKWFEEWKDLSIAQALSCWVYKDGMRCADEALAAFAESSRDAIKEMSSSTRELVMRTLTGVLWPVAYRTAEYGCLLEDEVLEPWLREFSGAVGWNRYNAYHTLSLMFASAFTRKPAKTTVSATSVAEAAAAGAGTISADPTPKIRPWWYRLSNKLNGETSTNKRTKLTT